MYAMYTGEYAVYCIMMTHCQSHLRVRYMLLNLANFLQFVHTLFPQMEKLQQSL